MKIYVLHTSAPLDRDEDGHVVNGTHMIRAFFLELRDDDGAVIDLAGPFDDEYDAEMAARRAREMATW